MKFRIEKNNNVCYNVKNIFVSEKDMKKNRIRILSILLVLMLIISSVLTINISAATEPTT